MTKKRTISSEEEIKKEQVAQALLDRAAELSAANGHVKVIPIWYPDPVDPENGKPVIGFLKEPNRATKGSILDTMMVSNSRAATIALNASLIKEVSDERITSSSHLYDSINIQAGFEALGLVRVAVSLFKKKYVTTL
jgi:hypothetical protein